jgi:WD40 repeat protein
MLSAAPDGTVVLVDPATGSRTGQVVTARGYVEWASMSYDGRLIATAAWEDGLQVEVHDVATGEVVAAGLEGPQRVAFAPDGDLYAATDGRITRHDPDDLSRLGTLPGAHGEINSLQFSSDGSLLLATANDETTSLYDVATGIRLGDPVSTAAPLIVPAFLRPDGQEMAVTVEEGVAVWDLDPSEQFEAACRIAGRELTAEEWATYFGDAEQVATCDEVLARRPGPPASAG